VIAPGERGQQERLERSIPVGIRKVGGGTLAIEWKDGHHSSFEPAYLRERCPCAHCVDELTGRRVFGPGQAAAGLEFRHAGVVGQYAVQIEFSDGHGTGLYAFETLRRICPCGECQVGEASA